MPLERLFSWFWAYLYPLHGGGKLRPIFPGGLRGILDPEGAFGALRRDWRVRGCETWGKPVWSADFQASFPEKLHINTFLCQSSPL